jgi:hypothetical protein
LGAIAIEPYAFAHLGDVAFAEAGIRAMLALLSAAQAGVNTGLVFLMEIDAVPHIRLGQVW